MYRRILLALDPEGHADAALPVVVALARRSLGQVVVLSVGEAETDLAPAAAGVVAGLESKGVLAHAEVVSRHANPVASAIVEAAHRLRPDLVALGSRGRGDLAGLLLGSVGHRVTARLDVPVLLVHDGDHGGRPEPIRRVLVAVDDSEEAMGAVFAAGGLAREHDAEVLVAHALHDDAVDWHGYPAAQDAAYARLDHARRQLAAPGRPVESRLLTSSGSAAARVASEADRWNADLIVVGSRRLTDLGGLVLGSFAHELVRRTHRPVLLAGRCRTVRRPARAPRLLTPGRREEVR
jgi:nucleotide-binding universal stress UspA family protein